MKKENPVLGVLQSCPTRYYAPYYKELNKLAPFEFTVFYFLPKPKRRHHLHPKGYNYAYIDRSGGRIKRAKLLFKSFRTADVWLIHGWNYPEYWLCALYCALSGKKLFIRGDSHLRKQTAWYKRVLKAVGLRWLVGGSTVSLPLGKFNEELFKHYGSKSMYYVPNFIDESRFLTNVLPESTQRLIQASKFKPSDFVVLFAGQLIDRKRPLDLITVLSVLALKYENLHLLIAGKGPMKEEISRSIKGFECTFLGSLEYMEMPVAYGQADLLVLPSNDETWGYVVHEAMLHGVPVIVSDQVGSGPDLVVPGVTGEVYESGNVMELEQQIEKYILKPQRCRDHGSAARQHVMENYPMSNSVDAFIEAIAKFT